MGHGCRVCRFVSSLFKLTSVNVESWWAGQTAGGSNQHFRQFSLEANLYIRTQPPTNLLLVVFNTICFVMCCWRKHNCFLDSWLFFLNQELKITSESLLLKYLITFLRHLRYFWVFPFYGLLYFYSTSSHAITLQIIILHTKHVISL